MNGYQDPEKEKLWGTCKYDERLKIITLLLSLRWVREICNFEDDFICGKDEYEEEYIRFAQDLATREWLDELPIVLVPFIFFSFNGKNFTAEVLENEVKRFFWHPCGAYVNNN